MRIADLRSAVTMKALWPVALMGLLFAGLYIFIELADEIAEGEALSYDESLLLAFRNPADLSDPLGPLWMEETALELTALGGYPIIVLLTLAVAGYLGIAKWRWAALYVVASVSGGAVLSAILKEFFERPRPEIVEQLDIIHTASFPSGHAMVGTVTYLTLGALLIRYAHSRAEIIYVACVAGFITVLVGLTRVYLGVHWPSDVIAGWALGLSWAACVWCVVAVIENRTQISAFGAKASGFLFRNNRTPV